MKIDAKPCFWITTCIAFLRNCWCFVMCNCPYKTLASYIFGLCLLIKSLCYVHLKLLTRTQKTTTKKTSSLLRILTWKVIEMNLSTTSTCYVKSIWLLTTSTANNATRLISKGVVLSIQVAAFDQSTYRDNHLLNQ